MKTTYTEMFAEIKKQISLRKKILLQRTLLATWPIILIIIIGYVGKNMGINFESVIMVYPNYIYAGLTFLLVCIYVGVISFILKIEKIIWIDSFFDKINLSPKESFDISKKLFWPIIKLEIAIFVRYYLALVLGFIAGIVGLMYYIVNYMGSEIISTPGAEYRVIYLMAGCIGVFIAIGLYMYFMKIKLRFIRFIFLDNYRGGSVDSQSMFSMMNQLNQIFKTESFKKALVAQLGVDTFKGVTNMITDSFGSIAHAGGNMLGGLGGDAVKAAGDIVNVYSKEYARQVGDIAEIVSMYVMYREVLQQFSGSEQVENDYIYSLK